jgi:hypothetical protein
VPRELLLQALVGIVDAQLLKAAHTNRQAQWQQPPDRSAHLAVQSNLLHAGMVKHVNWQYHVPIESNPVASAQLDNHRKCLRACLRSWPHLLTWNCSKP